MGAIKEYKTLDDYKQVDICANFYRGISTEISSEDKITRDIVEFVLSKSFGNSMWYGFDCDIVTSARCDCADDYDKDTGKEICNVKADLRYHRKMYDRYLKVAWILNRVSNRLMKYVEHHQKKIEKLEKDYEHYVK